MLKQKNQTNKQNTYVSNCFLAQNIDYNIDYTHNCDVEIIRITCPCNVYPLIPHFYIVKLGYAGVYLFFLFLLQNIDCGYSLEPPRRVLTIYVLSKNKKNIKNFLLKFFNFYNLKNLCILHGRVFVVSMLCDFYPKLG